jgi:hypothetical protein
MLTLTPLSRKPIISYFGLRGYLYTYQFEYRKAGGLLIVPILIARTGVGVFEMNLN